MKQVFRPKYDVEACLNKIRGVLESGWAGQGPLCKEFEATFCEMTGAKHAIFLSSATAGLHLALRLANVKPGRAVLTTPITFVSTNAVILYEGLDPDFCDIDPAHMSLSADALIDKIELRPGDAEAVIWVHYAGSVSPDFDRFMRWKADNRPDLIVIEDCAHAAGAFYADGKRVGSRSDTMAVFSFQAVKNCPTADSGLLVCPTPELDARARKLSWLGISKSTFDRTGANVGSELYKWRYEVEELGWKYNGNDVMAAIALCQLPLLDRDNAYRARLLGWYQQEFAFSPHVRVLDHSAGSSTHLVAVEVAAAVRDRVMAEMRLSGYAPGMHYLPNDLFPAFKKWSEPGDTPNAHAMAERIITLPTHLEMTHADIVKLADVVKKAAEVLKSVG